MTTTEPCNVCATTEVPTFEAGGLWWCEGCATWQTDHSADTEEDQS